MANRAKRRAAIRCAEGAGYVLQVRRMHTNSKCAGMFKKIKLAHLKKCRVAVAKRLLPRVDAASYQ